MNLPPPSPQPPVCYSCGYSLVGLTNDTCPECGTDVSANAVQAWNNRQRAIRRGLFWSVPIAQMILITLGAFCDSFAVAVALGLLLCLTPVASTASLYLAFKHGGVKWPLIPALMAGPLVAVLWFIGVFNIGMLFLSPFYH